MPTNEKRSPIYWCRCWYFSMTWGNTAENYEYYFKKIIHICKNTCFIQQRSIVAHIYALLVRKRLYLTQAAVSTQMHTFPTESFVRIWHVIAW